MKNLLSKLAKPTLVQVRTAALGVILGAIGLRFGQNILVARYNSCIAENVGNPTSLNEFILNSINADKVCRPNKIVEKIFFWQ